MQNKATLSSKHNTEQKYKNKEIKFLETDILNLLFNIHQESLCIQFFHGKIN